VGTVEISPQRIEMLLVCAQVLGIPTLISFLKRIRQSIAAGKISKEPPPIPTPPPAPSLAVGWPPNYLAIFVQLLEIDCELYIC
jgi:hypothetical protein